jgi:hypothetical protein
MCPYVDHGELRTLWNTQARPTKAASANSGETTRGGSLCARHCGQGTLTPCQTSKPPRSPRPPRRPMRGGFFDTHDYRALDGANASNSARLIPYRCMNSSGLTVMRFFWLPNTKPASSKLCSISAAVLRWPVRGAFHASRASSCSACFVGAVLLGAF